jgi:circadian clock protein KaiB
MMMSKKIFQQQKIKAIGDGSAGEKYVLQLFVTGISPNSARAIVNIQAICEKYLNGRYELEIIDIYQQPGLALAEDIIAVPTLIKRVPLPEIRVVGDLSDTQSVLEGLALSN